LPLKVNDEFGAMTNKRLQRDSAVRHYSKFSHPQRDPVHTTPLAM
jgi:hypothetical protein